MKTASAFRKKIIQFALILSFVFFAGTLVAQEKVAVQENAPEKGFNQAINMCPLGMAFGIFSANYEYMINQTHGIVFRLDYESVPNTYSDANINVDGKAAIMNYRYHLNKKLGSYYLGAFARYREYSGDGISGAEKFDFTISEFTIGLNAGKRWVWDSGFNINFTLGYGYSFDDRKTSKSNASIESAIDTFTNEYDFIDAFLGEFSIGYAF